MAILKWIISQPTYYVCKDTVEEESYHRTSLDLRPAIAMPKQTVQNRNEEKRS